MRKTKVPSRFTDHLDHYLVVFKDDNIKKIVSKDEIKNCEKFEKGASCDALWTDAHHKDWYPAIVVDIGDLEYLANVQQGRTNPKRKSPTESKAPKKPAKAPNNKEVGKRKNKGEKGKRKRSPTDHTITKTANTKFNQEENDSEEEREERKRKKLRTEAKAKKAAEAKATKEALLKQRLQQAKNFQISQQSCSLSHGYSHEVIGSESDQSDDSVDEYFPEDGAMHADGDDDLIELEVTRAYSSPLKELFQRGATKDISAPRKDKGKKLTYENQGQNVRTSTPVTSPRSAAIASPLQQKEQQDVRTGSTPVTISRAAAGASHLQEMEKQGSQPTSSKKCGREECRLMRQENVSLKQKIKELEKKLNEQPGDDTEQPLAGVVSPVIAVKYKMEEMAIGSGVYWYPTQKLNALAEGKTVGTMTAYLVDVMFDKNTLMVSNLAGGGNLGYKKLCPRIVQAITAFVQSQFKEENNVSAVRKTLQDKCTASRRGISKTK